jgi:hypothetical protein
LSPAAASRARNLEESSQVRGPLAPLLAASELLATRLEITMSVVRLLGFSTLACGCVVGRYRDVGSTREIVYVEEKGASCDSHAHRRNHTVSPDRERYYAPATTNAATA